MFISFSIAISLLKFISPATWITSYFSVAPPGQGPRITTVHMIQKGSKPELPRGHTEMLMSVANQRATVTMTYGSGHVLSIAECYYTEKCLPVASIWECWHCWIF